MQRFLIALGLLLLAACTPSLVTHEPAPPLDAPQAPLLPVAAGRAQGWKPPLSTGIDQQLEVSVGPPEATLATWILEPPKDTPVRGTILFLHGFMADHGMMRGAANNLRQAGYRAVLVDLRGFGKSTGEHITFGVLDAQDLTQLIDALQQKHLCEAKVGVYGTSYGAASAILYAAADPRVATVIAVAPYARIREEVPTFARHLLQGAAEMLSDTELNAIANVAARVAQLDLDSSRPVDAIQRTHAPILLIHGDSDSIVPYANSQELHAANPKGTELLTMKDRGHLDLCFDHSGELYPVAREWFDKHMGPKQ